MSVVGFFALSGGAAERNEVVRTTRPTADRVIAWLRKDTSTQLSASVVRSARSVASSVTPSYRRTTFPLRKISNSGIADTWNFAASCGLVLVFTLQTVKSRASECRTGFIARHGPHHAAQKSTSTGPAAFSTSRLKLYS